LILLLFNAPYPLVLGILAGALNFIPVVGPLLTGILLFVVIFLESVPKAIFVVIVFILIQQVENNILTPLISKKIIGLSPVLVLTALAVGGILWGFLGAILSIPLAAILFEFLREFLEKRKSERTAAQ
jgi:predicted PurR-regulated permease PerM